MAKVSREELVKQVSSYIGDRNDDESISLLENISDSFAEDSGEDWKAKYEENDRQWRDKYKARFMEFSDNTLRPDPPSDEITSKDVDESEDMEELSYDDLLFGEGD